MLRRALALATACLALSACDRPAEDGERARHAADLQRLKPPAAPDLSGMVRVPAGVVTLGDEIEIPDPADRPRRQVEAFWLDAAPVTNAAFAAWVRRTGRETSAEALGESSVIAPTSGVWSLVEGATWKAPLGPDSPTPPADHPVVHVSWYDADLYCRSLGKRLPTEVEWEHAARDGRDDRARYAFGDALVEEGRFRANVWTGIFPVFNDKGDGWLTTSPVGTFGRTALGLADMAGNVWEWTDSWFQPYDRPESGAPTERVQRGGSFLCDTKVCHGFRVAARGKASPASSHMHVGFRCAADAR